MEILSYAVVAVGILLFGLVSGRIKGGVITAPMAFTAFGYLMGHDLLDLIEFEIDATLIRLLVEATLILVLFISAARIDLRMLRKEHDIAIRLLLIGLPLTILAGALAAVALGTLSFWGALVLAVILTTTDAALGQPVMSSPRVPVRIRQALNVESGLNDGIALPILLMFLSLTFAASGAAQGPEDTAAYWLKFFLLQMGLGPLVGLVIGYAGSKLLQRAHNAGWIDSVFLKLSAVALAFLAFGAAESIHGNGFIAAFTAGLVMGNVARDICRAIYDFGEAEGQLLELLTFMVFGGLMVPVALSAADWPMVIYALLSLTVVRMLPVSVSLIGTRLKLVTVLFLGWFGPRGIPSILYVLLVLKLADFPDRAVIESTVVITVLISIFLHGCTANPGAKGYAAVLKRDSGKEMPEGAEVGEMPLKHTRPK